MFWGQVAPFLFYAPEEVPHEAFSLPNRNVDVKELARLRDEFNPEPVRPVRRVRVPPKRLTLAKTPRIPSFDETDSGQDEGGGIFAVSVSEVHVRGGRREARHGGVLRPG